MMTASGQIEETGSIGIIGAMDMEVQLLQEMMIPRATERTGGLEFSVGRIGDESCVVVQCGVGMVNAAACTQALIDNFDVRCVINTGVAGSLDESVGVGDLVIATDAVNWVMDVQNLGYEAGQTPGAPAPYWKTSDELRAAAEAAAQADGIDAHEGRVASGDRFVRDADEKAHIASTFGAVCCEMEGAAIAQVCDGNGVPCAILRVISDNADGSNAEDYPTFEAKAAKKCAALVSRLLSKLA